MKELHWLRSEKLRKLVMFLLVGGATAGLYASICTALVAPLPEWRAAISIAVHAFMIPIAFFGQRRLTFRSANPPLGEFVRYASLQIASITFSTWLLVRLVTNSPYLNVVVFLMIAGLAAIISFFICNTAIFNQSRRLDFVLQHAAKAWPRSRQ
jgi:putative flippase GtrA